MDCQHRDPQAYTGDFGLMDSFELAIEPRNIGRCATHIETDDVAEAYLMRAFGHADHAAGRA